MKIRKQVYDLTLKNFAEFPVWKFALDEEGQDEATVRPFEFNAPLDQSDGMFVVQAEFSLADGTVMKGYLTPSPDNEISHLQPIIIVGKGQIGFWFGIKQPSAEQLSSYYQTLGKAPEQIFPVGFKSMVELLGGKIDGNIDGFLYYSKDRKVQITK